MNKHNPIALSNMRSAALACVGVNLSNTMADVPFNTPTLANESLMVETSFLDEITAWAIGYGSIGNKLQVLRDFIAPPRPSPSRTIRVTIWDENEPFATVDQTQVKRSILGNFLEVRQPTATKGDRLVLNRGLSCKLDNDELKERPLLQQKTTQWLIDLLMRASVLESVALFQAMAVVNNTVWDAAANPDMEIQKQLIAEANITGFKPTRGIYGDTASFKRKASYDNQLTAGSLARSQMMTDEEIALSTGLREVLTNADRYQSSATAKKEIVGSNVFLFTAVDGESPEDPSNIVRHTASASYGGGEYAVYLTPHGPKTSILTVENYELMQTQHTTGAMQFVVV